MIWGLNIIIILSIIYAWMRNLKASYYSMMLTCISLTFHCYNLEETGCDSASPFKSIEKCVTFLSIIINLIIFLLITDTKYKFFINLFFTSVSFVGFYFSESSNFEMTTRNVTVLICYILGVISFIILAIHIMLAI